jgi:hypothetical protein
MLRVGARFVEVCWNDVVAVHMTAFVSHWTDNDSPSDAFYDAAARYGIGWSVASVLSPKQQLWRERQMAAPWPPQSVGRLARVVYSGTSPK